MSKYKITYEFWNVEQTHSSIRYSQIVSSLTELHKTLKSGYNQHLRISHDSTILIVPINTIRRKDLSIDNGLLVYCDENKVLSDVRVYKFKG